MAAGVTRAGLQRLISPTRALVQNAFQRLDQQDVKDLFESYQRGALVAYAPYDPQDLEIIHSDKVHVSLNNTAPCLNCDCHDDLNIEKGDSEWALNFAGYSCEKRCYVFKGQQRLLERFLDMVAVLFVDKEVAMAIVRPRGLSIPLEGLNSGMDFEQFASYIEIMECALLLDSAEHDPLKFDEMTMELESPMATQVITRGGSAAPSNELTGAKGQVSEDEHSHTLPEERSSVDVAQRLPETTYTKSGSSPSSPTEARHRYPLRTHKEEVSYRF